ncbi:MAG: tRNA (adenosine(37)-N6)-threonylcarbamoyltransferase complex ATPase subunit type 1 TsaE [Deltaproteobacteria bacterium]
MKNAVGVRLLEFSINSDEEMEKLGEDIASILKNRDLIYLMGELGAGKTTLVRGIARGLGYGGRVTSPTFTLMNIYQAALPVFHFDFYRLEGSELVDLGLEDYLEQDGIALIEWPQTGFALGERTGSTDLLPSEALFIKIELTDEDYDRERQVTIFAQGDRYRDRLKELQSNAHSGHR